VSTVNNQFDVVVVGSGPAGVHAAYPLIKAGLRVAMIDGGLDSKKQEEKLQEFPDAKLTKSGHYYDFVKESSYVFNKTYELLPIKSNIDIIQSLARGGLSEVWHGICDFFSENELVAIGLPSGEIKREYKEISKLIKLNFRTPLDLHGRLLLEKAKGNTHRKNSMYQVPLVFPYRTNSFIEELRRLKNFVYLPNQLVYSVKEKRNHVEIQSFSIDKKDESTARTSFLILAAGSINTTRIILRSFKLYNYKTSFLTKANYFVPCLHLRSLGKKNDSKKGKYGQLVISSKESNRGVDSFFIQLYRLNPLFLHKGLPYISIPKIIALPLLSVLAPYVVIADIKFPAFESKMTFCKLKKETGEKDTLEISFKETNKDILRHKREYNKIRQQLWSLGLFPLRTIFGYITSHYAGGVFSKQTQKKTQKMLSVDKNGKLYKANKIYIADSSSWKILPAKPPTLTIMANAARVGKNVLKRINKNKDLQK